MAFERYVKVGTSNLEVPTRNGFEIVEKCYKDFRSYLSQSDQALVTLVRSKDKKVRQLNSPFLEYNDKTDCRSHFEESEGASEGHHVDILQ